MKNIPLHPTIKRGKYAQKESLALTGGVPVTKDKEPENIQIVT